MYSDLEGKYVTVHTTGQGASSQFTGKADVDSRGKTDLHGREITDRYLELNPGYSMEEAALHAQMIIKKIGGQATDEQLEQLLKPQSIAEAIGREIRIPLDRIVAVEILKVPEPATSP